jgi:hypothetical protein
VLIAAQHAQILVTEHVEDGGGRDTLASSRVAAESLLDDRGHVMATPTELGLAAYQDQPFPYVTDT